MKQLLPSLIAALSLTLGAQALAQTTTSLAGVGDSTARPTGAWALPAGLELARPITGYSVFTPDDCAPEDEKEKALVLEPQGAGDLVRLCLVLRNVSDRLVPFELPPSLFMVSESVTTQNGINVLKIVNQLEPGTTMYIPLYLMCLNEGRSGSSPGSSYVLGPVLDNQAFSRLFQRLEDKRVPQENAVELQAAVWALSQGKAIPASAEAWINALPEA